MSENNTPETIGKALIVGVIAVMAWTSAPTVALCAGAASAFCAGRWIAKNAKEDGAPWA